MFLRVPGLLAIMRKRGGAHLSVLELIRQIVRDGDFTGPLARRGVSLPPSIMPSTPSHRKTSWTCSIAHPPSWLLQKRPNMGIRRDALLPERAAQIRRDTGEVRDSFGSLGDARVRSGALAVPIRGPRPAIVPPLSSGSEPRSSRRRVGSKDDIGCGPSDWSTGYQFRFSSRAPIRDDSGFRKPSTREHHSRKGAKILVNRLSTISVVTKNPDCPRYFGPISVPAPRRCHPW